MGLILAGCDRGMMDPRFRKRWPDPENKGLLRCWKSPIRRCMAGCNSLRTDGCWPLCCDERLIKSTVCARESTACPTAPCFANCRAVLCRARWNWDGSILAVARNNWPDIEIWDVPTWTLKRRLTLFDASRAELSPFLKQTLAKPRPKSEEPYGLSCGSLCFDRHGNLFVVEGSRLSEEVPTAFPYTIPRGAVFWNAADGWTEINDVDVDLGLSVASLEKTTRLAYWNGPYHTVGDLEN